MCVCFRLPAASFLNWLRQHGPEELAKAQKAEASLKRHRSWETPKRVRKPPKQALFTATPPPLEAEMDEYDTE